MKKNLTAVIILLAVLILSACSATTASPTASAAAGSGSLTSSYQDALSANLQLALGTLKLEEGSNAVDSATASVLLPLWKAVRSLSASDTTSALELQAVFTQIEESMSASQVQAIAAMQLTSSDLAQEMATLAPVSDTKSASSSTPANTNASAGGPGGGQMPPGDMAGGAPAISGGGDVMAAVQQSSTQTTRTASSSSGSASAVPTAMLNAVITLLEGKV
jgi:hypothetical protein